MAGYRRRRRRIKVRLPLLMVGAAGAVAAGWWIYFPSVAPVGDTDSLALNPQPRLTTDRPEVVPDFHPRSDVSEKGETPPTLAAGNARTPDQRVSSLVSAGKRALEQNDPLGARSYFSEAMQSGVDGPDATLIRAELTRIGQDTIFSPRVLEDDPYVARYVIQPGDSLGKIAKANKISDELLASINGIRDKNRIRAGRAIKVIKGPLRAVVDKSTFSLDVYLGQTFVTHFRVGLGADGSTPTGEWKVGTKLVNPTYYPPRGGLVMSADDPQNPLGERWIGLIGTGGEAVGLSRYGIHGTIEPESIGQNISMGCIRMFNEDVELLYTYLVEKHSTVTVQN